MHTCPCAVVMYIECLFIPAVIVHVQSLCVNVHAVQCMYSWSFPLLGEMCVWFVDCLCCIFVCSIDVPFSCKILANGCVHGLAFWFDVVFSGSQWVDHCFTLMSGHIDVHSNSLIPTCTSKLWNNYIQCNYSLGVFFCVLALKIVPEYASTCYITKVLVSCQIRCSHITT